MELFQWYLVQALSDIWFRKSAQELLDSHQGYPLRDAVARAITHWKKDTFEPRNGSTTEYQALLPLLFMNWEKYPLVKYDPVLRESILKTQKIYLTKAAHETPYSENARFLILDFLRDSGLQAKLDTIIKRKPTPTTTQTNPSTETTGSTSGSSTSIRCPAKKESRY